jgi:hypothetical protein
MDNNQQNQGQQLQIEVSPEAAKGTYSNLAIIYHSHAEFVLDFAQMQPQMPKATVGARVIMAPEHAKRLLAALNENIMRYEHEFGPIEVPEQKGRTIAPFAQGKGEA